MPVNTRAMIVDKGVEAANLFCQGWRDYFESMRTTYPMYVWKTPSRFDSNINASMFDPKIHALPPPAVTQPSSPR